MYDVPARAVRSARPIPVEVGLQVAGLMREAIPGTTFALERTTGSARSRRSWSATRCRRTCEVGPARRALRRPDRQAARPARGAGPRGVLGRGRAARRPPGHHHLVVGRARWSRSAPPASPRRARWRCSATSSGSRADEVVAFGDMPNDLAMLAWAGTSYAMANAHPSVLALAGRRRPQRGRRRRRGARGALRPLAITGGCFSRWTTPNISSGREARDAQHHRPHRCGGGAAEGADQRRDEGADAELHAAQHRGRRTRRLAVPGQRERRRVRQGQAGGGDQQRPSGPARPAGHRRR